ncbi:MAG: IS66 family transposase, partial [Turicibacter sp.]
KVDDNQIPLWEDSFFEVAEETDTQTVEEITYRRQKKKGKKAELLKDLPYQDIHFKLEGDDCICADCGQELREIGMKVIHELLRFKPAILVNERHIQHSYACPCHNDVIEPQKIQTTQVPKAPIRGSFVGPSLLAEVIHKKFVLSVPFYRQVKEWVRHGLDVSRRTLSNWVIVGAHDWLIPLSDLLRDKLVQNEVLHADETRYQILNRLDGRDATSQARMWLFRTTVKAKEPIVYYHAALTRERSVAAEVLNGFKGYLNCDGYSVYKNLPGIKLVACLAHIRRKFCEVPGENGKAKQAVDYCNEIFRIEKEIKHLTPQERYEQRQEKVKPVFKDFFNYIESIYTLKGKLQTAVTYAINQKEELLTVLDDGLLEVSNNIAEQAIRPIAIGRKNYLFSTSVKGATANALCYTIIETAKANGLNACKYLEYLFEKLPNTDFIRNPEVLEEFLPWTKKVQELCR